MTGHDNGVITINLAEADDAERETAPQPDGRAVPHPARPFPPRGRPLLLGPAGARTARRLDAFRALFGDERQDYGEALQAHYAEGAAGGLADEVRQRPTRPPTPGRISPKPWRTTSTSSTRWRPPALRPPGRPARRARAGAVGQVDFDPYRAQDIEHVVDAWLPLTFAVNSLNRSMGQPDLYPVRAEPGRDREARLHAELLRKPES